MTYEAPSIWGSGIRWGSFRWGGAVLSGPPTLYVTVAGELVGEARTASFRLGRGDWFEALSPQNATVEVVGELAPDPNDTLMLSCDAGTLWRGYVDEVTQAASSNGETVSTITATDIVGLLGVSFEAPGRVVVGPTTYRWIPVGYYGDLMDVLTHYIGAYAPSAELRLEEGPSTSSFPALIDWYDSPDNITLLELINLVERSSNAMIALQPGGELLVTMRSASGLGSVVMVDLADSHGTLTRRRGRSSVINHWVLDKPAYNDSTALDTADTVSVAAYGDRTYSIDNYLGSNATHFGVGLRTALANPRWQASATFPISDLSDPALMLAPLAWAQMGGDVWQVMSVEHQVGIGTWSVTASLDVSQDALNDTADPTPA